MRTFRLLALSALAVTLARADQLGYGVEAASVYADFLAWDGTSAQCSALGNPAQCQFNVNFDIIWGPTTADVYTYASSGVNQLQFDFRDNYPRGDEFTPAVSYLRGSAGFWDTVYVSGPAGQPAIALLDSIMADRICNDRGYLNMYWWASFDCRYMLSFAQPITLGRPFSLYWHIDQGNPYDVEGLPSNYFDMIYSIESIRLFDLNGNQLTGLRYTTASGVDYHIEGGTFVASPVLVPEPSTVLLLVTAAGIVVLLQRKWKKR